MQIPAPIADYADEMTAIRRDLHAHPELGFEEVRTSGVVADKLREYGVDEMETGIGRTGVVAVIKGNRPGKRIGLRADMDALPIHEQTNLPYASKNAGVMHACGHDSHTTMLLGAAKYLAETRDFAGEAVLIFQPAEEGLGGAREMIADGLFDKFPVDEVYGLHNSPFDDPGQIGIKPGAAMAGANFFDIKIIGKGGHAARPEGSVDALVVASGLARELHTIVSRNVPPSIPIVLSVTQIHAGAAYNVIPEDAMLAGTVRYFDDETMELVSQRMRELCAGYAIAYGAEIDIDIRNVFDVLRNDDALSAEMLSAAIDVVGSSNARQKDDAVMGSEDFADMLAVVPGAYCTIGHAGDVPLHNPAFVLDDDILPVGASLMARMVEVRGAA
ncbi:MAG: M20 family metallopeptidase [Paracoccaceae bacterium]|nr:M20 family metallopeptidase [Paracoccaceae bacterium]MDG1371430.1 M20 family metallopeptidase [Paracoccaceae bacterium]